MQFNKSRGFNLIELVIVIAIIGILAGISYPSYVNSARKAKLEDAREALGKLATALTRAHTTNVPRSYEGLTDSGNTPDIPDPTIFPSSTPLDGTYAHYGLTIESATASAFTIRATGIAGVDLDPNCLIIEMSSDGTRTPSDCW